MSPCTVALWPTPFHVVHDHPPGASEHDPATVDRQPADREDAVAARVEAGGLDVDGEQPEVGQRGVEARQGRLEVVAQRPGAHPAQGPQPPLLGGAAERVHEMYGTG